MDVLDHLTADHRDVEKLLDALADSEPGTGRVRLVDELEDALELHMAVEEQFLYPIVAETISAEEADEGTVEHSLARQGITALRDTAGLPGFGAAVEMLKGGIGHHVHEEETEMFPKLRRKAGDIIADLDPEALEATAGKTLAEH